MLYSAWGEFQRSKIDVSRQCRVNEVDLERSEKYYGGVWETTLMDEDGRSDVFVSKLRLSNVSYKSYAWKEARK